MHDCSKCDRELVCKILGECFLKRPEFQTVPTFLKQQITKARSVSQALLAFKQLKLLKGAKHKKKRLCRRSVKNFG